MKTTINPPTITRNMDSGIHAENVRIRVSIHTRIVCIKIINPSEMGWFNEIIILQKNIMRDTIILTISASSL